MIYRMLLAQFLLLAACAPMQEMDDSVDQPVMVEENAPVVLKEAAISRRTTVDDCLPGDDGIGGTGCKEE